jgi:hypothetical protein
MQRRVSRRRLPLGRRVRALPAAALALAPRGPLALRQRVGRRLLRVLRVAGWRMRGHRRGAPRRRRLAPLAGLNRHRLGRPGGHRTRALRVRMRRVLLLLRRVPGAALVRLQRNGAHLGLHDELLGGRQGGGLRRVPGLRHALHLGLPLGAIPDQPPSRHAVSAPSAILQIQVPADMASICLGTGTTAKQTEGEAMHSKHRRLPVAAASAALTPSPAPAAAALCAAPPATAALVMGAQVLQVVLLLLMWLRPRLLLLHHRRRLLLRQGAPGGLAVAPLVLLQHPAGACLLSCWPIPPPCFMMLPLMLSLHIH